MTLLNIGLVTLASSALQTQFKATFFQISWVLHVATLVGVLLLVPVRRLADTYGDKRFAQIGFVCFLLGSLLCTCASTLTWLLGGRLCQAIGATLLCVICMPAARTPVSTRSYLPIIRVWGSPIALALAVGPIFGSVLVTLAGWRSLFLVNIPLCLIGFVVVTLFVPESQDSRDGRRISICEWCSISVGLVCLVLALLSSTERGWATPDLLSLCGWSAVGFIMFFLSISGQVTVSIQVKARPNDLTATQPSTMWSSLYFFSRSGMMTVDTIKHHLMTNTQQYDSYRPPETARSALHPTLPFSQCTAS